MQPTLKLAGKNALVTGGASGIGRAIALRLAAEGADVAIFDVNSKGAQQVAEEARELGRRTIAVEVDVSQSGSVVDGVDQVHGSLGPIQVLINDAGIAAFSTLLETSEEAWDRMIAVHLKGTFNCCRAVLPDMVAAKWGRIVNMASLAGVNGGGAGLTSYAAAKAGIIGFTKALAHEVSPLGITANAIAPGLVDTPLIRGAGAPADLYDRVVAGLPVKRIGQPDDIAAACAFLVSKEASFVTGQVMSPNGGGYM
jgi:NAD(P)-dependent dehydrogenase (short-subunit alcohol dehydrogenase family)